MIEQYPTNGFLLKFENGWTISVIWNAGSYSGSRMTGNKVSKTAEIAAWDKDNKDYKFNNNEMQIGWQNADEVAKWIQIISNMEG